MSSHTRTGVTVGSSGFFSLTPRLDAYDVSNPVYTPPLNRQDPGVTVVQTPRQTEEDLRKKRILLESMKSREVKVSFHVTTMCLKDTVSIYLSPELMSKLAELVRE